MQYMHIPEELKNLPQWVCFKFVNRANGLKSKVPVDPNTGKNAKANDPSTWGSFNQAVLAAELYNLDGIGFEFANGIFGIDLDHVIDKSGNITPEAKEIVETMNSYTEYSPSGTGLHILCYGNIPKENHRNGFIEIYSENRFFTVTGKVYKNLKNLEERTAEAFEIHKKFIFRENLKKAEKSSKQAINQDININLTDEEILEKIFNSSKGSQIQALWNGDMTAYNNDHSRADLALIRNLAYWTNGNKARIDQLFRKSALMRDKWDRKQSGSTWGDLQIEKVLTDLPLTTVLSKKNHTTSKVEEVYSTDESKNECLDLEFSSVYDYLQANFREDREQFMGYKQRKTGFSNIDEVTGGLYPGLYVIGAQSSLGKTTFIHQIGDQLAEAGDTVLFFSLEQSLFELCTKSLARESFKIDTENPVGAISAIELRAGEKTERVKEGYKSYMKYAKRVIIKECNFDENIESIEKTVEKFIASTNIKPVVIIDYLQIIPALDPRVSDKEKTDQHMKRLKILQRNHDLVLFVISSLNRANYLTQVSFESFKESGGIEYTADVIWGMQYSIVSTDPVFKSSSQGKISEQRRKIQEAKIESPRKIELVCLKNRYGRDYSAYFEYYPKYDYFAEDDEIEQIKHFEFFTGETLYNI